MKKLLMITLVLVFSASMASAQVGNIGLFADVAGTVCDLTDAGGGLTTFYAVHVNAVCATASQFAAVIPGCWTGVVYLSDSPNFGVTIGNTQTGVAVGYGANLASPVNVIGINVLGNALTTGCCRMTVTPDPNIASGEIEIVDCANALFQIGTIGGSLLISTAATGACNCNVATEEATWGGIKNIYGNQQ